MVPVLPVAVVPSSFLADAWAKSDFGLTLLLGRKPGVSITGQVYCDGVIIIIIITIMGEVAWYNILSSLLAAKGAELGGAGAHNVVRRRDVLGVAL